MHCRKASVRQRSCDGGHCRHCSEPVAAAVQGAPLSQAAVAQQPKKKRSSMVPHQGAQENRVLPHVAAVQVCDEHEGVDLAFRSRKSASSVHAHLPTAFETTKIFVPTVRSPDNFIFLKWICTGLLSITSTFTSNILTQKGLFRNLSKHAWEQCSS